MSWFCIPCTYSPGLAEESSQTSCLGTLQSVLSKSKTTPEEFCCKDNLMGFSRCFPFGTTLRRSAQIIQKPQPCLTNSERYQGNSPFVAGSRSCAKTSHPQEKEQVSPGQKADYGKSSLESLAKYDLDSSSWKILRYSKNGDLKLFSEICPKWGTMRSGELSELTTSVPLTSVTGSGLWPTVKAHAGSNRRTKPTPAQLNGKAGMDLSVAVRLWATPCARPANGSPEAFLERKRRSVARGNSMGISLTDLNMQVKLENPNGGSLNPTWTEWLMGWPLGWTELGPLEMGKFRQWQQSHGIYYAERKQMTELEIKTLKQQYATPWSFMDWVIDNVLVPRGRGRFGIDVCASADNAKAPIWFTELGNGLEQSWQTDDLAPAWCNPPFKDVQPWLEKAHGEAKFGGVLSCVLTHMDHSTDWYRAGMSLASEVIHINPRINFEQHPKLLSWMKENNIKPGGNDKQNTLWVFDPEWLPDAGEQAVITYPKPWR